MKTEVLEKLAFDPTEYTVEERMEFAYQGKYLSILINDEHWDVRAEVAYQGYGLDVLINDESWEVRKIVREKLDELKKRNVRQIGI